MSESSDKRSCSSHNNPFLDLFDHESESSGGVSFATSRNSSEVNKPTTSAAAKQAGRDLLDILSSLSSSNSSKTKKEDILHNNTRINKSIQPSKKSETSTQRVPSLITVQNQQRLNAVTGGASPRRLTTKPIPELPGLHLGSLSRPNRSRTPYDGPNRARNFNFQNTINEVRENYSEQIKLARANHAMWVGSMPRLTEEKLNNIPSGVTQHNIGSDSGNAQDKKLTEWLRQDRERINNNNISCQSLTGSNTDYSRINDLRSNYLSNRGLGSAGSRPLHTNNNIGNVAGTNFSNHVAFVPDAPRTPSVNNEINVPNTGQSRRSTTSVSSIRVAEICNSAIKKQMSNVATKNDLREFMTKMFAAVDMQTKAIVREASSGRKSNTPKSTRNAVKTPSPKNFKIHDEDSPIVPMGLNDKYCGRSPMSASVTSQIPSGYEIRKVKGVPVLMKKPKQLKRSLTEGDSNLTVENLFKLDTVHEEDNEDDDDEFDGRSSRSNKSNWSLSSLVPWFKRQYIDETKTPVRLSRKSCLSPTRNTNLNKHKKHVSINLSPRSHSRDSGEKRTRNHAGSERRSKSTPSRGGYCSAQDAELQLKRFPAPNDKSKAHGVLRNIKSFTKFCRKENVKPSLIANTIVEHLKLWDMTAETFSDVAFSTGLETVIGLAEQKLLAIGGPEATKLTKTLHGCRRKKGQTVVKFIDKWWKTYLRLKKIGGSFSLDEYNECFLEQVGPSPTHVISLGTSTYPGMGFEKFKNILKQCCRYYKGPWCSVSQSYECGEEVELEASFFNVSAAEMLNDDDELYEGLNPNNPTSTALYVGRPDVTNTNSRKPTGGQGNGGGNGGGNGKGKGKGNTGNGGEEPKKKKENCNKGHKCMSQVLYANCPGRHNPLDWKYMEAKRAQAKANKVALNPANFEKIAAYKIESFEVKVAAREKWRAEQLANKGKGKGKGKGGWNGGDKNKKGKGGEEKKDKH